jgi:hypothetical protein
MSAGRLLVVGVCLAFALLAGCKSRKSPRDQINETIAAAEQAAEEKDLGRLKELISERYSDAGGNDRAMLVRMLQLRFLQARAVHLLVRVPAIHLPTPDRAEATVLAGMASSPIAGPQQLANLSADVYRFELVLAREAPTTWRVVSASWSPAQPSELF